MTKRFIAVDWSGNVQESGQRKHIWMGQWQEGRVSLSSGRTRSEAVRAVIAAAREEPSLIAGFDFSFGLPAWFLRERGCADARQLWQVVASEADAWIAECRPPFWGRPKTRRPDRHHGGEWLGFRATERTVARRTGRMPSSTFQIGGAGTVGTGSLRGMPHLLELQAAGFSVWPFDPPRLPIAIEIYPRIFTGRTNVSDAAARARHLEQENFSELPATVLAAARNSPDAFDALCALIGMVRHRDALAALVRATDPIRLVEGEIWMPGEM